MGGLFTTIGKLYKARKLSKARDVEPPKIAKALSLEETDGKKSSDEDAASEASFYSTSEFRKLPSPSPAPLTAASVSQNKEPSLFTVEIPSGSLEDLTEYESVVLESDSDDGQVLKPEPTPTGINTHLTPPASENPRRSLRNTAMDSADHSEGSAMGGATGDAFEDTAVDRKLFAQGVVELEDPNDDDWVPQAPRSRSRSAHPTPGGRAKSRQKLAGEAITASSPPDETQNTPSRPPKPPARKTLKSPEKTKAPQPPAKQPRVQQSNATTTHTKEIIKPKPTPIYKPPSPINKAAFTPSRRVQAVQALLKSGSSKAAEKATTTSTEEAATNGQNTSAKVSKIFDATVMQDEAPTASNAQPVASAASAAMLSCIKPQFRVGISSKPKSPSPAAQVAMPPQLTSKSALKRKRPLDEAPAASKALKQTTLSFPMAQQDDSDCEITGVSPIAKTTRHSMKKTVTPPSSTKASGSNLPAIKKTSTAPIKKDADFDFEFDSDIEIYDATPRKGTGERVPVEVESDDDLYNATPRKGTAEQAPVEAESDDDLKIIKVVAKAQPAAVTLRPAPLIRVKVQRTAPAIPIPIVKKKQAHIDLTGLSDSEESDGNMGDAGGLDDSGESEDSSDPEGGSSSDDSSGSEVSSSSDDDSDSDCTNDSNQVDVQGQPALAIKASSAVTETGTVSSTVLPTAADIPGDGGTDQPATYIGDDGLEWPALEWFNSDDMAVPYTTARLDEIQAETEAREARAEVEKQHGIANQGRWLKGEPYVPLEQPSLLKRERDSDDEHAGIKERLKRQKMDELAAATIRSSKCEGFTSRYVRPRRNESELLLAGRMLDFKIGGWKKRLVDSRGRKFTNRAILARKCMLKACKEEKEYVKQEVLKREALEETMAPN